MFLSLSSKLIVKSANVLFIGPHCSVRGPNFTHIVHKLSIIIVPIKFQIINSQVLPDSLASLHGVTCFPLPLCRGLVCSLLILHHHVAPPLRVLSVFPHAVEVSLLGCSQLVAGFQGLRICRGYLEPHIR